MYIPQAFRVDDVTDVHQIMREARSATLVTATQEGLIGTPLPMLLERKRRSERHALRSRGKVPNAVTDAPADFIKAQLRGIVGLRMPISRLDGKRKMSQNRNLADRAGLIHGLSESHRPEDHTVASLIPQH